MQGPMYALLNMVHMGGWMKYTIYHSLDQGPSCVLHLLLMMQFLQSVQNPAEDQHISLPAL